MSNSRSFESVGGFKGWLATEGHMYPKKEKRKRKRNKNKNY